MSKIKIYGNANPVIGIKEYYSIHDFFGSPAPSKFMEPLENIPDENIKWSVWILLGKEWVKMTKNNKTGATIEYTFTQTSLKRKGIRMLVDANGEKAVLDIKTKNNVESKILHIEILDNLGKKPTKLFSYGETITARIHCLNMEKFRINVTLWENDGGKKDLSDISIETKEENVLNGIADVKFTFDTSKVWLANAKTAPGESNEGAFHEYYVTAEFYKKVSKPTQDINVINPDYKVDILSKTSASKPSEKENKKPSPAEQKGPSKKETRGVAKTERKAHDYHEQKVDVKPTVFYDAQQEFINSLTMVNVGDSAWHQKNNCGEKYCIKKGSPNSELIREINIRLAGFGGNVPTDEFTDRTEKMIKQFQRDFMKVPETGKVCGNVLKAIDDFQNKYTIHFDDLKCKCGECNGFGNGKFHEQKQDSKIEEAYRKYEYPGIHRSLVWALRATMFYCSVKEKQLSYSVKCIVSGYRCHVDNKQNKRNTTNHMGKALDVHFNKNGKRILKFPDIILEMEEIRLKIFNKYLGAKWDWKLGQKNIFNLESTSAGAKTWVHYDVREYNLEYLKDEYFAKSIDKVNGENIIKLATKTSSSMCNCIGFGSNSVKFPINTHIFQTNNFTIENGKDALKIIYEKYGKEIATIIE